VRHTSLEWERFAQRVIRARWIAHHKGYVFLEDEEGHLAKKASPYEMLLVLAREAGRPLAQAAEEIWVLVAQDAAPTASPVWVEPSRASRLFEYADAD
jgi:hypothetical protein